MGWSSGRVVRGDPRPATFYLSGPTVPGTGALLFMAERAAFRRPGGGLSFRGGRIAEGTAASGAG
jgi:hypothetical protein